MKRRRHSPEQIVRLLAEGEKLLGEGKSLDEVVRHLEITESTWHRWRNQYGGMKADDAKELRELRRENQRLKKIVADLSLDNDMLKELNRDAPIDQIGTASAEKSARRAWNISRAK
jgi:putative transposase